MKLYRILHKPTGLYYQNSVNWQVSSLGPKGKLYKRSCDIKGWDENLDDTVSITITNGLYKKIKDILDDCGYEKERYIRYPQLRDSGIDRYNTWIYYVPKSDFEIIEKDV